MESEKQTTSVTAHQPEATPQMGVWESFRSAPARSIKEISTKDAWLGDYDFGALCMPSLNPWKKDSDSKAARQPAPFFGLEDELPILVAAICGLQHCLAMLAGLITPPIILSSALSLPSETQSYLVSASLISCGILSAIQMSRIPLPFGYQLGTGLLSVVGTSFATLSTATAIFNNLYKDGTCPTLPDGSRGACPEAYGYLIGTSAVCALLEMALSFVPVRMLRRAFPPMITGPVVLLIGLSLVGESGFLNWGGDSGPCHLRPETGIFTLCPTKFAPHALPWGSAEYLGLGFLSFITIVFVELFGSPAMRNASIIIGLLFPLVVAGPLGYADGSSIKSAPAITFLWTTTFPLKVYGPAVLPLMAVYLSLLCEAIGDITATSEVSRVEVDGPGFDRRIAGGILSDGLGGMLSALFTVTPLSVFAQNVSVITLTKCANRKAGYWCCFWLILFGILGKISGAVLAIPKPILGGVTTFLFASVATSGLKVISLVKFTRRNRFVLAASLSLGAGNLLVSGWPEYLFTYAGGNKALRGFLDSIIIVISTPFLISAITGMIANAILPRDLDDASEQAQREGDEEAGDKMTREGSTSSYTKDATLTQQPETADDIKLK